MHTSPMHACTLASHADLFAKRALSDGLLPASSVNAGFPHNEFFAKQTLNHGVSPTSLMIQPNGADKGTSFVVAGAVT